LIAAQSAGMRILEPLLPAALLLATLGATSADPVGGHGHPPGPPPEAIAACKGKAVGDSVSFTGRRGETLTGTCQKAGDVLAARPNGMPPPGGPRDGGGGPPPQ
jgi:hypothetical protein